MRPRALVVDDDADLRAEASLILQSLGHDYDLAECIEDARALLATNRYDYFVLDLELPVQKGRMPRIENGMNFITEVKAGTGAPVIAMTGHGNTGPTLAREAFKKGVVDYVPKPLARFGPDTLDKTILEALARRQPMERRQSVPAKEGEPWPFNGGEVVYYPDRVTLLDVDICLFDKKGKYRQCLDLFRQKNPSTGNFIGNSSQGLQKKIGFASQNDAIKTIGALRRHITDQLLTELNCECGEQDVIPNDRKNGYRFEKWINVKDADEQGHLQGHQGFLQGQEQGHQGHLQGHQGHDQGHLQGHPGHLQGHQGQEQGHLQGHQGHDQGHDGDRRTRILAELKRERLRVPDLAARLGCSPKTIKRDLDTLKAEGVVAFVGPPRTGYYAIAAK